MLHRYLTSIVLIISETTCTCSDWHTTHNKHPTTNTTRHTPIHNYHTPTHNPKNSRATVNAIIISYPIRNCINDFLMIFTSLMHNLRSSPPASLPLVVKQAHLAGRVLPWLSMSTSVGTTVLSVVSERRVMLGVQINGLRCYMENTRETHTVHTTLGAVGCILWM